MNKQAKKNKMGIILIILVLAGIGYWYFFIFNTTTIPQITNNQTNTNGFIKGIGCGTSGTISDYLAVGNYGGGCTIKLDANNDGIKEVYTYGSLGACPSVPILSIKTLEGFIIEYHTVSQQIFICQGNVGMALSPAQHNEN
jgi:hypothetical protein